MLRGLPQNLGVQGRSPALPAQLLPGEGNGSWFVFTFLLGRQKLPQLQRNKLSRRCPAASLEANGQRGRCSLCPQERGADRNACRGPGSGLCPFGAVGELSVQQECGLQEGKLTATLHLHLPLRFRLSRESRCRHLCRASQQILGIAAAWTLGYKELDLVGTLCISHGPNCISF